MKLGCKPITIQSGKSRTYGTKTFKAILTLLSTDEEITGDYHKRLRPWVGHTYQLTYDDKTSATHIVTGYLSSKEAA